MTVTGGRLRGHPVIRTWMNVSGKISRIHRRNHQSPMSSPAKTYINSSMAGVERDHEEPRLLSAARDNDNDMEPGRLSRYDLFTFDLASTYHYSKHAEEVMPPII